MAGHPCASAGPRRRFPLAPCVPALCSTGGSLCPPLCDPRLLQVTFRGDDPPPQRQRRRDRRRGSPTGSGGAVAVSVALGVSPSTPPSSTKPFRRVGRDMLT